VSIQVDTQVQIQLSPSEVNVIKIWADTTIHGGHWGDGDFAVPEEHIILQKINDAPDGRIELNKNEIRIILTWSESSRGIHTMEEENVINKLRSAVDKWKK